MINSSYIESVFLFSLFHSLVSFIVRARRDILICMGRRFDWYI